MDPAILLLDKATAALDLAAEAAASRATEQLAARHAGGRAPADHRGPRRADHRDGGGTHDELLAADGGYTAIWAAFSWLPERLRLTRYP